MLGYDTTVQPVRSFSERPAAPQPFYADQQGNVSGARPLAGSEAGYQERLTAAQQIQAATDEALAKQRAKVDADMAAMEASRLQAEQLRAADLARKQAEAEAQNEAIRQQIEAKRAADRASLGPVETPAPVAETPAPIAQGPVKPVEMPAETGAESLFDWGETAPKAEPKKRDVSVKNARAQAYKDFEDILKGDSTASATDILKEFEKELSLRQMRVYNAAYDAAIVEGKDASQAARAGNQALRQAKLPPLAGDRATTRMKPKDSTILEQKLAQQWYEGLDAGTKADIDTLMQATGKDLHQTFVDFSSKPTRKSLFDEPVESPKSNPNEMGMMTNESGPTFANLDEFNQEFFANTLSGKETVGIVADRNAVVTKKRGEYGDNIDIKGLLDDGTEVYITQDPIGGFNPIIGLTDSKPTDLTTSYTVKRGGHSINQVYKNGTLEYERVTYPNGDADTWYASTGGERSYGRDLREQAPIAKMAQDLIK
jgi:hypothetical protein